MFACLLFFNYYGSGGYSPVIQTWSLGRRPLETPSHHVFKGTSIALRIPSLNKHCLLQPPYPVKGMQGRGRRWLSGQECEAGFFDPAWNTAAERLLQRFSLYSSRHADNPGTAVLVKKDGAAKVRVSHLATKFEDATPPE